MWDARAGAMAGYSGTPLWRKLTIKPGHVVCLVGAPSGWAIADLPDGVTERRRLSGRPDLVVAFFTESRALVRRLPRLVEVLDADAGVWVAWPRKAAGHVSDITENELRALILPTGLVDVKVAALDDDWSGLKFVWRRELRATLNRG